MIYTIDPAKVQSLSDSLIANHFSYIFGGKINPITLQAFEFHEHGIRGFDCSSESRWLVYHASGHDIGEGSVEQYAKLLAEGFETCPVSDGHLSDGKTRLAVLDGGNQAGGRDHVMVLVSGSTHESYGHHGPGSRLWGSEPWMHECKLLVIGQP